MSTLLEVVEGFGPDCKGTISLSKAHAKEAQELGCKIEKTERGATASIPALRKALGLGKEEPKEEKK